MLCVCVCRFRSVSLDGSGELHDADGNRVVGRAHRGKSAFVSAGGTQTHKHNERLVFRSHMYLPSKSISNDYSNSASNGEVFGLQKEWNRYSKF